MVTPRSTTSTCTSRRSSLRRALIATPVIALLTLAPLLQPIQADAAPQPGTAGLHASTSVAATGSRVVLSGAASLHGRPLSGQPAVVQHRVHGTRTWHTLQRVTTSISGRVSVRTAPLHLSEDFRLQVSHDGTTATSDAATVQVPTWITVTATSSLLPIAGDTIALYGTSSPQLAGARADLQLEFDGQWRRVASTVVGASAFDIETLATAGGDSDYRVVVPAAPGRPAATSGVVEFSVSAWYRLSDLDAAPSTSAGLLPRDLAIGSGYYEQSFGAPLANGTSASVAYDLGNRCSSFRATVGPSTDSDVDFIARQRVLAGDAAVLDVTTASGQSQSVTAGISGAGTLELRSFALTGQGDAAWGDPEVLCSGRP